MHQFMFDVSKHIIYFERDRLGDIGEVADQFLHFGIEAFLERENSVILRRFVEIAADPVEIVPGTSMVDRILDHMPLDHKGAGKPVEFLVGSGKQIDNFI